MLINNCIHQLAGSHLLERGLIVSVTQPGQTKFVGSPNALYQFPPKQEQRQAYSHACIVKIIIYY